MQNTMRMTAIPDSIRMLPPRSPFQVNSDNKAIAVASTGTSNGIRTQYLLTSVTEAE